VYKYETELNGLLEGLDKIDSYGDAEVREKRKEVVKAVEKALEGVEHAIGEVVEKRLSLIPAATPTTEESVRGFDVDEDVTEGVSPAGELVDAKVVDITAPESPASIQVEEAVVAATEMADPVEDRLPESDTSIVIDATTDLPAEPTFTGPDFGASTVTIAPATVELTPLTELEQTTPQVQVDVSETVDTFLLPEQVSLPSPAKKPEEVGSDTDEVLVLDSDVEKSDWSELEH